MNSCAAGACYGQPCLEPGPWMAGAAEEAVVAHGIRTADQLYTAMGRSPKSPALIDALLAAVERTTSARQPALGGLARRALVEGLTLEPELGAAHLSTMAELTRTSSGGNFEPTMAAIAGHGLAHPETVICALWSGPGATARAAGLASSSMLPAAISWVNRAAGSGRATSFRTGRPTPTQRGLIHAAAARWTALAAGEPGLGQFIRTSSFDFTCEDTMLAAGQALLAAPSRPVAGLPS